MDISGLIAGLVSLSGMVASYFRKLVSLVRGGALLIGWSILWLLQHAGVAASCFRKLVSLVRGRAAFLIGRCIHWLLRHAGVVASCFRKVVSLAWGGAFLIGWFIHWLRHDAEWGVLLPQAGFVFDFVGIVNSSLPLISYAFTKHWEKVLNDCFTAVSLEMQVVDTSLTLLYHLLYFPKPTSVWPSLNQLSMLLASAHAYTLHNEGKRSSQDGLCTHFKRAVFLIGFFILSGYCLFAASSEKISGNPFIEERLFHICWAFKIISIGAPVFQRWLDGNWAEDFPNVLHTKMAATWAGLICSVYELLLNCVDTIKIDETQASLWSMHTGRRFMILLMVSIVTSLCQIVCRGIGPTRFKSFLGSSILMNQHLVLKVVDQSSMGTC